MIYKIIQWFKKKDFIITIAPRGAGEANASRGWK